MRDGNPYQMQTLDISPIVVAFSNETMTAHARLWAGKQDKARFLVSDWAVARFSSETALKLLAGQITPHQRAAAMSRVQQVGFG